MSSSKLINPTPTEATILALLRDGEWHSIQEIMTALGDEYMEVKAVQVHLSNLRPKLDRVGRYVFCRRFKGVAYYKDARLVPPE